MIGSTRQRGNSMWFILYILYFDTYIIINNSRYTSDVEDVRVGRRHQLLQVRADPRSRGGREDQHPGPRPAPTTPSRHFEQEFGRKIPTSTIHDWVKKEQGGARRSMERPRRSRRRSMKKKGIRSYHRYNDEQRNEVVRWHLENERKNRGTLEATSRHFEQEFGRKIPTSTIHDWVNKAKRK